jgi:hypothetical protein
MCISHFQTVANFNHLRSKHLLPQLQSGDGDQEMAELKTVIKKLEDEMMKEKSASLKSIGSFFNLNHSHVTGKVNLNKIFAKFFYFF